MTEVKSTQPLTETKAEIAFRWWDHNIRPRDTKSRARSLAACLRRGDGVTILSQPEVQKLASDLEFQPHNARSLIRLSQILSCIREDDARSLATIIGGNPPLLSPLRFQKILRAEFKDEELVDYLRRAVDMAGKRCNVKSMAGDLIYWGEAVKTRWCFDYFGS
ncbi:hypothetical protein WSS15_30470 [Acetobacter pasteurianus]|uniref:Uncharacterized protein n=1 Tax=Acetobacter pasteurianus NBRC 3278 TaxID=1226660 RepID=A0A401X7U2_ACEPA|nr:type I-E CRISPR-associated protein Cse2/CasB [Acetobacter pasteurianus]GCD60016.1 hypothetical protein NBRC3277_2591 [Acetobacter pasteurianus NBRC 3277]GCD63768.1 hypothetical protein NBRC3278_2861 [Acetobacter pasteurianus NBRC 3278]GCD69925.1 hypothetical protein NBRC3280_2560 [Acetobacter pasteurianus NBRC 3280]GLH30397.1 hypothetical protein WSS15_30470 [Acetobacter pasteurianus]